MFWLSICQTSEALDAITDSRRPWANLEKFWRFCQLYGDYQATPPSHRRQFIMDREQVRRLAKTCAPM